MKQNNKQPGQSLTTRQMKNIKGGYMEPIGGRRKNVCVICGPGNVHCTSVPSSWQCDVVDYTGPGSSGWIGCKSGSQEYYNVDYNCTA